MLKTRVITALILAPLVVAAIYLLPVWAFACFIAGVIMLGAWEWSVLLSLTGTLARVGYICLFALLATAGWFYPSVQYFYLGLAGVAWLLAVAVVIAHPRANFLISPRAVIGLLGLVICLGAWSALLLLRAEEHGAHWVMWLLVLCWAADIGAYFAGRAIGRRKLAPSVSPGKTWEGAIGGAVLAVAVCGGLILYSGYWQAAWLPLIVLLVAVSVFGDLFESVLKRLSNIKDSGSLLPGHGGILDRIDSILAAAPAFALLAQLFSGVVA